MKLKSDNAALAKNKLNPEELVELVAKSREEREEIEERQKFLEENRSSMGYFATLEKIRSFTIFKEIKP